MHEHIARTMYYCSVHLLFASMVGLAAWTLTSILRASTTTKYWVWVVTAFNFVVPSGAFLDKLWAPHLTWARPFGVVGDPIWVMTEGRTAIVLGTIWATGAVSMLIRLLSRLLRESREARASGLLSGSGVIAHFMEDGIPVSFGERHQSPAVRGVLSPRVLLPAGIDRLLNRRELHAVLIHELAHARRRDNLIRLLYEVALCVLWFHPLVWLAGARIGLYRELSCDESVISRAHGQELVSALVKLAGPQQAGVLQATASSHLSYRLARLTAPTQPRHHGASLLLTSLFVAVVAGGIFQTIAHTACCFVIKHLRTV